MKTLLLSTILLTACASRPYYRSPPPPPPQIVVPVAPGDVVTVHPAAPRASRDEVLVRSAAPAPAAYDAELTAYPYPFEVRFVDLRSQDETLRMAYMDEQPPRPNGRVVLLLHGMNFTSAYWQRTIQALLDRGFRVIAPDQVGFGKSSKPVRYQFSFSVLCDNTRRLLESLGVHKVSAVGHSLGGMMAVRCAIQNPALYDRVALVNPIGLENWQDTVPYRTIEHSYHLNLVQSADDIRAYMRVNYFGGVWSPIYEEFLDPLAGWISGPDRARIAWDRALIEDMIFTQPVLQDFPRLQNPTLLVIGQRDRTALGRDRITDIEGARLGDYPALGKHAAKLIPHSKLVELAGAGHLPMVDAFEEYIRVVADFLGRP